MTPPELTVLTLTLNEVESLKNFLRRVEPLLSPQAERFELLIVDGGSTDGTLEVAREAGARVILQDKPGYANAYLQGLAAAQGRFILCVDADSSHPLEIFHEFWRRRNDYDVVMGSRYLPGGEDGRPWLRRLMSRLLNWTYARFLSVPLTDISGGFRLYRAEALRGIHCSARYYDVVAELIVRLHGGGRRILEIPYHYIPRGHGRSKAKLLTFSLSYVITMIQLWWER